MKLLDKIFDMFNYDGCKHIILSAILVVLMKMFLPICAAIIVVAIMGIAKEVYDKVSGKEHSEWKDLLADVVGILIGIL